MDATLSFGDLVRRRRLGLDLTQAELARRVGCATDMVRKIEAGRRRPSAQVAALLAAELDVPPAERAAFMHLARRQPGAAASIALAPDGAPPADATPLIGRAADVEAVRERLLRPGVRLLTLVGPGGVGKTRLAARVASLAADAFRDGVCWVALDTLRDPALVLPTIAHALHVHEVAAEPPLRSLCNALRERHMLLALDNLEHLLEAGPQLAQLLEACPQLQLLATSREALRLKGEQLAPVAALGLPPADARSAALTAQAPAVALFVARAQALDPSFALTDATAGDVAALCRLLDGLPLAIELAAARVRALSPAALLQRGHAASGQPLMELLSAGPRDAAPRHQSLWNTLAWSYDLLPADARRLLRLVSVCTTATPELLAALAGEAPTPLADTAWRPALLGALDALLGASLLRRVESAAPRFALLDTVRAFALAQLEASGEAADARGRHAALCAALAERANAKLRGPEQERWLEQLEGEHGNMRAALDWLLAHDGAGSLRLAVALASFWGIRGYYSEGCGWLGRALDGCPHEAAEPGTRAAALTALARLLRRRSQYDDARARVEEAIALWRALGDRRGLADALGVRGVIFKDQSDLARARADLEASRDLWATTADRSGLATILNDLANLAGDQGDQLAAGTLYTKSLHLWRAIDDRRGVAVALNNLGILAGMQENYAEAHAYFVESLAIARAVGNQTGIADTLMNLGHVAESRGDYAEALACYRESLALHNGLGDRRAVAAALDAVAELALSQRQMERAAWSIGAAAALRAQIGAPLSPREQDDQQKVEAAVRAALDAPSFACAFDEGYAATLPAAIARLNKENEE